MKIHPAAQILTWCMLVAMLQFMALGAMLLATGLILLCAFAFSRHKFIQLLRRTRWLLLSLLVIYAYSIPGQPLTDALGMFSPSREGLSDGVLQLARLVASLSGLAILLDRLHRQQLIAGLYMLFAPLHWLGMSRDRLAVRLALTLHYADVAVLRESYSWQESLRSLFESHGESTRHLELPFYRFAVRDALILAVASLIFWLAI